MPKPIKAILKKKNFFSKNLILNFKRFLVTISTTFNFEISKNYIKNLIEANPCQSNPCRNGGVCQVAGAGYYCQCPPSYYGNCCQYCMFSYELLENNS